MMPNTTKQFPTSNIDRKYPRSNSGPDKTPMMMSSQACTVPIQDMALGEEEEERSVVL
jgi:hypothetical protein